MDCQFDATADSRRLKFLHVIDEHSRFCADNEPGFIAQALQGRTPLEAAQPGAAA